jgi:hypothetical protein
VGVAQNSFDLLGFGTVPLDLDHDGFEDLFVTNGHVLGPLVQPSRMRPQLLHNREGRRFDDVSAGAGRYFEADWLGRGVASADFDNDGDLDLLVTHLDEAVSLLQNDSPAPACFIGFRLETRPRASAAGARVIVRAGNVERVKSVVGGGSYLSDSDSRVIFALPAEPAAVEVEVVWPSGVVESFSECAPNAYWLLRERQVAVREIH